MSFETGNCDLYPTTTVTYGLFINVQNCKELQAKTKEGETKISFVNPRMVDTDMCVSKFLASCFVSAAVISQITCSDITNMLVGISRETDPGGGNLCIY